MEDSVRRRRKALVKTVSTKLEAALWVVASIATIHYTALPTVLVYDERVNRFWLNIGLMALGIDVVLVLYLAVYLPYIARIDLEWNVYCPRVIPTATVCGVIATFAFMFGLWPVFGLLTPAIEFVLFLGFLMSSHFIPCC